MTTRGVRGATTSPDNTPQGILAVTRELLQALVQANGIAADDVGAAIFTVTADLDAAFPARAARDLGWDHVPLLDACEVPVPGSLPRCIRVLLLWNTDRAPREIVHLYLRGANVLRPDLGQPVHSPAPELGEEER